MKAEAIVEYGAPLQEVTLDTPVPQGTEILVKVTHCGVCHSDVHLHDGYFDMGGGNKLDVRGGRKLPFTLGHEIEGEVIAVGPDAEGVKVGDQRVIFPWIGCGSCPTCNRGDEHLCNKPRALGINVAGGYATHCLELTERLLLDVEMDIQKAVSFAIRLVTLGEISPARDFLSRHVPPQDPAATWVLCDVIRSMTKKRLPEFLELLPLYEKWGADPSLSAKERRSIDSAIKTLKKA